jgi:UDP-N-acetylglucosamine 2-epimerase (non-hydrolysing)
MRITIIAGARPNFIKVAPIIAGLKNKNSSDLSFRLVHTGQHFDDKMSDIFFRTLNIPRPDVNLGCGGGSQAEQTAAIMIAFEKELISHPADLVLVVGDVTSTMACSIVAKKQNIKVAHVEAGLRSFDLSMPEEINRLVTDCLSDYYFTTTVLAGENLIRAGADKKNIFFVGNVMIDTLLSNKNKFIKPDFFDQNRLKSKNYIVLTLHRPANVDEKENLFKLLESILENSNDIPVVFPIHPRTRKIFNTLNLKASSLITVDPMGYLEFNYLVENSFAVITDSGGITEETTVLGIPCVTIRNNTERPETVSEGTNELIGTDPIALKPAMNKLFNGKWKKGKIPEKWDGHAATRIVEVLSQLKINQ